MISWVVAFAFGAELTEMPPKLRGDLEIVDSHRVTSVGLSEAGQDVGRMVASRNDLRIGAEFAPIAGIALRIAVPVAPCARGSPC